MSVHINGTLRIGEPPIAMATARQLSRSRSSRIKSQPVTVCWFVKVVHSVITNDSYKNIADGK